MYFLYIFSNEHQNVQSVNHPQKYLINGICGSFDMKSNYFGPLILKKLKKMEKLDKRAINCKKTCFSGPI